MGKVDGVLLLYECDPGLEPLMPSKPNSTDSNKAVCVLDFGADKSATSGTFQINFPTNDENNALIRIA